MCPQFYPTRWTIIFDVSCWLLKNYNIIKAFISAEYTDDNLIKIISEEKDNVLRVINSSAPKLMLLLLPISKVIHMLESDSTPFSMADHLITQTKIWTIEVVLRYYPDLIDIAFDLIDAIDRRLEFGGGQLSRAFYILTRQGRNEILNYGRFNYYTPYEIAKYDEDNDVLKEIPKEYVHLVNEMHFQLDVNDFQILYIIDGILNGNHSSPQPINKQNNQQEQEKKSVASKEKSKIIAPTNQRSVLQYFQSSTQKQNNNQVNENDNHQKQSNDSIIENTYTQKRNIDVDDSNPEQMTSETQQTYNYNGYTSNQNITTDNLPEDSDDDYVNVTEIETEDDEDDDNESESIIWPIEFESLCHASVSDMEEEENEENVDEAEEEEENNEPLYTPIEILEDYLDSQADESWNVIERILVRYQWSETQIIQAQEGFINWLTKSDKALQISPIDKLSDDETWKYLSSRQCFKMIERFRARVAHIPSSESSCERSLSLLKKVISPNSSQTTEEVETAKLVYSTVE